jgi:hypothetical protein
LILDRIFELYEHVVTYAKIKNKEISIELGTEEQSGSFMDTVIFENFLEQIQSFCSKNKFQLPLFVVVQTGTKVMENRNVGLFETGDSNEKNELISKIKDSIRLTNKFGILAKEHNADYLNFENLSLRPLLGIKAANVAPEFGYIETTAFMKFLKDFGTSDDFEQFIEIVNKSDSLKKWLSPNSNLSSIEKAQIAGHYCYSNPEVIEIKERLKSYLLKKNIDLNIQLKKSIHNSVDLYSKAFGLCV